jgi:hypothetical protein
MRNLALDCEGFYRRDFLKIGAAVLPGLGLAELLRSQARASEPARSTAKSVIFIWLGGGPATIDMWDMKPDAPENIRGDFSAIRTKVPDLRICEFLPETAKVADRCVVVRSLHHNVPAHGPGTVFMATGHAPTPAIEHPSIGSLAAKVLPATAGVPAYVSIGAPRTEGYDWGAGYLGPSYNPFEVEQAAAPGRARTDGMSLPEGFSVGQLENRRKLRDVFDARFKALDSSDIPASLDRFGQQALDILRSDRTRKAFDLDRETGQIRDAYGRNPFGQSVLTSRRLIEAGARFVTVGLGGWDTHSDGFRAMRTRLLPQLDKGLGTLIGDLDTRGLLRSTVVYCAGEFGRTPTVNRAGGRDHWARSMAVLLAGGGLSQGLVYGGTDAFGQAPDSDDCMPADIAATLFHLLGVEPSREVITPTGRPMAIFREGRVLEKLLS